MEPITFRIHYCAEDGFESDALALARRLFAVYDTGIDALSLVPTRTEQFALYFNEQLLCSLQHSGRPPAVADVRAFFGQHGITVVRRPGPEAGGDVPDDMIRPA